MLAPSALLTFSNKFFGVSGVVSGSGADVVWEVLAVGSGSVEETDTSVEVVVVGSEVDAPDADSGSSGTSVSSSSGVSGVVVSVAVVATGVEAVPVDALGFFN